MGTQYQTLYDSVTSKIKDYDLLKISDTEVNQILSDYIRPAVVKYQSAPPERLQREDSASAFVNDLEDYEIEVLADFMVAQYIDSNFWRSAMLLKQSSPNKDLATFSPANQLKEVGVLRQKCIDEANQLMRDYAYINSPLYEFGSKRTRWWWRR